MVLEAGSLTAGCQHGCAVVRALLGHFAMSSRGRVRESENDRDISLPPLIRLQPYWIRALMYEFWGNTVHFMAVRSHT